MVPLPPPHSRSLCLTPLPDDDDDCGFRVIRCLPLTPSPLVQPHSRSLFLLLFSLCHPTPLPPTLAPLSLLPPLSLPPPHPSAFLPVNPTQVVIPIEELDLLERLGAGPAGRHRRMEAEEAEQSRAARLLRSQDQQLREAFTD